MKTLKSLIITSSQVLLLLSASAGDIVATKESLKEDIPFNFFTTTPIWNCNLEPIDFRLKGKPLKRAIKKFFYTSYRTFDFSTKQDEKNGETILYNNGNTWAHEFRSVPSKTGNVLRSVGDWEPPEHTREGVKAENVMTLRYYKNHFVAQLEEHVHQLKAGTDEIVKSDVIPVSILYCYSEKYLAQSLINLGDDQSDIALAKDLQQKREYLDGRPASPGKAKELRTLNTKAKVWLKH